MAMFFKYGRTSENNTSPVDNRFLALLGAVAFGNRLGKTILCLWLSIASMSTYKNSPSSSFRGLAVDVGSKTSRRGLCTHP